MTALKRVSTCLVSAIILCSALAAAAQEPVAVDTLGLAKLSPDELFVRASSAELQFADMLQPSRRILVRNHEDSLPYLVTRLDTDGPRERHALEDILVRIGDPAVGPLTRALMDEAGRTDTTRGVRLAAGILGRLGDERATEPLSSVAGHENWKVRSSVADALGRIGGDEVIAPVVRLMSDENEVVRKSAAVSLRRIASGEGAELGGEAVAALVSALGDTHYSVRTSASAALGEIGDEAVEAVEARIGAPGNEARHAAICALGLTGSRRATGTLTGLLDSDAWTDRAWAVEALGRIGLDEPVRAELKRMEKNETHPYVLLKLSELLR